MNAQLESRPLPETTLHERNGSVRILRDAIACTLGDLSRSLSAVALAASGSLLVRITSGTKRGPVAKEYRITQDGDTLTLHYCTADSMTGYHGDCREVYTLDSSFGGGVVRCDCPDARLRCHDVTTGSQCKHRKACAALGLCE